MIRTVAAAAARSTGGRRRGGNSFRLSTFTVVS